MTTIEDIANDLNCYIVEHFKYKHTKLSISRPNVHVYRKKIDLYIRYKIEWRNRKNVLVIARIGFKAQLKGHGTNFLKFLCQIAQKHKYSYIGIECANSNAQAFGIRFGFKIIEPKMKNIPPQLRFDFKSRDLIIKTSDLIKQFI